MAQVNISLEDQVVTDLDRIAIARGVRRPHLLRSAIQELIESHDAGRLAFQAMAGPTLDGSINALVFQLRELVMELDRAQVENARIFGRLIAERSVSEQAIQNAQDRLTDKIRERNTESYSRFYEVADKLLSAFSATPTDITSALEPHLARISDQLETSIELARAPRQVRALYLGDNQMLSLRFLSACAAMMLVIGGLIGLIAPDLSAGWSVWQAGKLIDDPAGMCRVINSKYGMDNCAVPERERDLGLKIIALEGGR